MQRCPTCKHTAIGHAYINMPHNTPCKHIVIRKNSGPHARFKFIPGTTSLLNHNGKISGCYTCRINGRTCNEAFQ